MQSALQISRKIDYALRAIIFLAHQPKGKVTSFREIARLEQIPEEFLAKILRSMVSSGIINSTRGPKGGYALSKEPESISFNDVIVAAEGPIRINTCLGEDSECPVQDSCLMMGVWSEAQLAMVNVFKNRTIRDVMKKPRIDVTNTSAPIVFGADG